MNVEITQIRVDLIRQVPEGSDAVGLSANLIKGGNASEGIAELKAIILGTSESVSKKAPAEPTTSAKAKLKKEEPAISEVKAPEETAKEVETPVAPKEEKKAPAVKVKGKATPYDRTVDTHKKLLSKFLDTNFPQWKDSTNLPKAGAASQALNGKDFLDAEGEVLQSFKDAFLEELRK